MAKHPLVSIVLPTYNGEAYIDQAVESCCSQTYPHWELILVDDCSTDSTPSKLQAWQKKDARIRVIRNVTNKRLPRSLNIGFKAAQGDFLTWTSDDNLYRPEALEKMVNYLLAHSDKGFVYADCTWIDPEGQVVQAVRQKDPSHLISHNCINACFMYRKNVLKEVGEYDPDYALVEDYEYWLRVADRFPMGKIEKDLYLYRIHPKSLSSTSRQAINRRTIDLQKKYLEKKDCYPTKRRSAAWFNIWKAEPSHPQATLHLWRALKTHPAAFVVEATATAYRLLKKKFV